MQIRHRHLSLRVPWHDSSWNGTVCQDPAANCHCIEYTNISAKRDVAVEIGRKGESFTSFANQPACHPARTSRAAFWRSKMADIP